MLRLKCSYQRQDDDSYLLTPMVSAYLPHAETLLLNGPNAQLWEILVTVATASKDDQAVILPLMDPYITKRLLAVISILVRAGCLEVDAGFASNTIEPPMVSQLHKIHFEITNRCNFKCRACYLGPRLSPTRECIAEGTTDEWIQVVREAATLGCRDATITGGEPFVRSDVVVLLHALTQNGITAEINTNASLITPQTANALRSLLISTVAVTLYGFDRYSTAAYTGNAGGYKAALRGIRCLVEAGVPVFVKYFATHNNADGFPIIYNQLKQLGVNVRVMGHGIHGDVFTGTLPDADIMRPLSSGPISIQETELPCYPALHGLGIGPDGTVRACPKLTVYFGNVFADGLTHIWQKSADLSAFRDFWIQYCAQRGYVTGARRGSLCPAGDILSLPNGLKNFRDCWSGWSKGDLHD